MLPPPIIANAIERAADFPGGPSFRTLTNAIGLSLPQWLPTGVVLQGLTVGLIGAGVVNGTLIFMGNVATAAAELQSGGVAGPQSSGLARALCLGLTEILTGSPYVGVSIGVSLGTDVSFVASVNTLTLASILESNHRGLCTSLGGLGSVVPGFYLAVARGIGAVIQTGVTIPGAGVVAPSGIAGPLPAAGTSVSAIV